MIEASWEALRERRYTYLNKSVAMSARLAILSEQLLKDPISWTAEDFKRASDIVFWIRSYSDNLAGEFAHLNRVVTAKPAPRLVSVG